MLHYVKNRKWLWHVHVNGNLWRTTFVVWVLRCFAIRNANVTCILMLLKGCKRELMLSAKFLYLIGREKVCIVNRFSSNATVFVVESFILRQSLLRLTMWHIVLDFLFCHASECIVAFFLYSYMIKSYIVVSITMFFWNYAYIAGFFVVRVRWKKVLIKVK